MDQGNASPVSWSFGKWEALHQGSIDELKAQQQATLDLIGQLDHQIDREALLARYQDGLTWDEVAQRLQYSVSNLKRRHKLALEQLEVLDDNNQTR